MNTAKVTAKSRITVPIEYRREASRNGRAGSYAVAVKAFGETPDPTFKEHPDIPWTEREELL